MHSLPLGRPGHTRTYAVVVMGQDEAVVAAAVEGADCVPAGPVPAGISLTLVDV